MKTDHNYLQTLEKTLEDIVLDLKPKLNLSLIHSNKNKKWDYKKLLKCYWDKKK